MNQVANVFARGSGSLKVWTGIITGALNLFAPQLGIGIEVVERMTHVGMALIGGTAIADVGKHAARERIAEAKKIREQQLTEANTPEKREAILALALEALMERHPSSAPAAPTTPKGSTA